MRKHSEHAAPRRCGLITASTSVAAVVQVQTRNKQSLSLSMCVSLSLSYLLVFLTLHMFFLSLFSSFLLFLFSSYFESVAETYWGVIRACRLHEGVDGRWYRSGVDGHARRACGDPQRMHSDVVGNLLADGVLGPVLEERERRGVDIFFAARPAKSTPSIFVFAAGWISFVACADFFLPRAAGPNKNVASPCHRV